MIKCFLIMWVFNFNMPDVFYANNYCLIYYRPVPWIQCAVLPCQHIIYQTRIVQVPGLMNSMDRDRPKQRQGDYG